MTFPERRKLNDEQRSKLNALFALNVSSSKIIKYVAQKFGILMTDYDVRNRKKENKAATGNTDKLRIRAVFHDILRNDPGSKYVLYLTNK